MTEIYLNMKAFEELMEVKDWEELRFKEQKYIIEHYFHGCKYTEIHPARTLTVDKNGDEV